MDPGQEAQRLSEQPPPSTDPPPSVEHPQPVPNSDTSDSLPPSPSPAGSTDTGTDTAAGSEISSPTPTQGDPFAASLGPNATPGSSSWSSNSDLQLGHGSTQEPVDPADRVFPIRSVLTVEPSEQGDYFQRPLAEHSPHSPHGSSIGSLEMTTSTRRARSGSQAGGPSLSTLKSPIERGGDHHGSRRRHNTLRSSVSSGHAEPTGRVGSSIGPLPIFSDEAASDDDDDEEERAGTPPAHSLDSASITESISAGMTTVRFEHVMTEGGHAVITGRQGTLQRCEDEPIHAPGAVQGFGALVAIAEDAKGNYLVRYASENTQRIVGYSPQQLFRLGNFLDIFTEEQAENLLDHIDFIRDEEADPGTNGPEVFSVSIRPPQQPRTRAVKLWCAIHVNPSSPDLTVCEFELDDDLANPLRPPGEATPDIPEDTLHSNPTAEELAESTEVMSRPLRVLRSARKRRGEAGAMQVFDIMSQVQEQLASAANLAKFLKILVGIVKELTGFHRVMVYQFDSSFNGRVVTELVDTAQTRDLYKGLHFPASDIPKQARELYKLNKVRLLYDRDQPTARLVCRTVEDLQQPLDLTHSYLRAMSPIHLKYLGNMAVRSSMSISINAFDELWGLIACHSYGKRGMRVSFPIRKMCRLVGDTASRNIERLSYASRLQSRKLINTVPTDKNPSGYIIASSDDLLRLFDADFGALSIRGETKILGKLEQSQEILVILEYLRLKKFNSVLTTQDVGVDFADLRYPHGFSVIAGALYVPLSSGGNDFIVFFRQGQVHEVKWAGNPYQKSIKEGTEAYLQPRKSFKVWNETIMGKSREWTEEQIETAAVLCLVYGKFIEVWRQKEAALQSSKLTRLLLANSAHEVRTPLNAIINYLEIAMEGSLDQETRDNLAKSHSASKSLIYVINDLLDLTKAEEGQELIKDEIFDLAACIREATQPFVSDAKRKNIGYEVTEHPGLPRAVYGDQGKVRQAVANVTANAMQHTTEGSIKIEAYVAEILQSRVRVEIVVEDTGSGMGTAQLDALFRELEQVSADLDHAAAPSSGDASGPGIKPPRTLGLGLAVVARIVRNMDGQLRLKSDPGKGSRFVIQLPFDLPLDDSPESHDGASSVALHSAAGSTVSATGTTRLDGEVTLVDSASGTMASAVGTLSPKKGAEDAASIVSRNSANSKGSGQSAISDADRLIDAIQLPLAVGAPESKRAGSQRHNSKGPYYHPSAKISSPARSISPVTSRHSGSISRVSPPASPRRPEGSGESGGTGMQFVTDSKTPLKPVKIPDNDEYRNKPEAPQVGQSSRVLFELPETPRSSTAGDLASEPTSGGLQVLCAEDDPINMKLLRKRLEKAGHAVFHTVNGADCASVYKEKPGQYDVVLMDMQMPIVDGLDSTKMIRAFEESVAHAGLSEAAAKVGRIPIFAVSASLLESQKPTYVGAGFDGWILKPIDFKRLETLLAGINDVAVRRNCFYEQGHWERGGWFDKASEQQQPQLCPVEAGDSAWEPLR
ncbi:phytochrome-1 [Magnaporthiopsis poae ATCC 64411]|uniref:Phytochrome-1 n=1 Tax=Magnaporthiopsis poae (strain ATCC 64411 / 73-15) TaxID=644358 RepID=A0A0C4EEE8_MAGP6|nr:phytochrome-1 [Magnaporthiopsis poae ATCC 64411]